VSTLHLFLSRVERDFPSVHECAQQRGTTNEKLIYCSPITTIHFTPQISRGWGINNQQRRHRLFDATAGVETTSEYFHSTTSFARAVWEINIGGKRISLDQVKQLLPKNARSIWRPVLALVSKKEEIPLSLAKDSPSALEISLLSSRSHLLPVRTTGGYLSQSFTWWWIHCPH